MSFDRKEAGFCQFVLSFVTLLLALPLLGTHEAQALVTNDYEVQVDSFSPKSDGFQAALQAITGYGWTCMTDVSGDYIEKYNKTDGSPRLEHHPFSKTVDFNFYGGMSGSNFSRKFQFSGRPEVPQNLTVTVKDYCYHTTYTTHTNKNGKVERQPHTSQAWASQTCESDSLPRSADYKPDWLRCNKRKSSYVGDNPGMVAIAYWLAQRDMRSLVSTTRTSNQYLAACKDKGSAPVKVFRLTGGLNPRYGESNLFVNVVIEGGNTKTTYRIPTSSGLTYGDIQYCGPTDADGSVRVSMHGDKKGLLFRDDYDAQSKAKVATRQSRDTKSAVITLNRRLWFNLDWFTPRESGIGITLIDDGRDNSLTNFHAPAQQSHSSAGGTGR